MWDRTMDWFAYEVNLIEEESINFINESFKKLRSAEAAYDLFRKFKHIRSRKGINDEMMKRFNDILQQFTKEVFDFSLVGCTSHIFTHPPR